MPLERIGATRSPTVFAASFDGQCLPPNILIGRGLTSLDTDLNSKILSNIVIRLRDFKSCVQFLELFTADGVVCERLEHLTDDATLHGKLDRPWDHTVRYAMQQI